MKTLLAVLNDFKIYFNHKTKTGRKHLYALGALILVIFVGSKLLGSDAEEVPAEAKRTEVTVSSVSELSGNAQFDTIGKVEAVSEANLQAEAGGRITAVNVKVGDSVGAGAVLATIENSAQRAALVQAQGSYEAALAASAQSGIGKDEAATSIASAKNAAVSVYKNSYNTVNGVIYNNTDTFFENPNSLYPQLKIKSGGLSSAVESERASFNVLLPQWQTKAATVNVDTIEAELVYAKQNVDKAISFSDSIITIVNQHGGTTAFPYEVMQQYATALTGARASLIATRSEIESAQSRITSAKDAARRAELSASGGAVSASDAQVKIALGSLQSAQANYQKTIVRSPIQGVVNAFYLKTGDYASPGQPAGIVANNNGLQIKTFVNEIDSANLNVGDVVTLEGGATGVITAKASALDPSNGKVAVVVGVNPDSGLTNGATVKVTFSQISEAETDDRILVPLSALKITVDGTAVFTVSADGTLVAVPVTKGQLYGDTIEILSGITKETQIVTDARGLKEGQEVTIKN